MVMRWCLASWSWQRIRERGNEIFISLIPNLAVSIHPKLPPQYTLEPPRFTHTKAVEWIAAITVGNDMSGGGLLPSAANWPSLYSYFLVVYNYKGTPQLPGRQRRHQPDHKVVTRY
jgi:hypothetical protein